MDQGKFVLVLVVGVGSLNAAVHRDSQVPYSVQWAQAAGEAGCEGTRCCVTLFLLQEQHANGAVKQGTYIVIDSTSRNLWSLSRE